MKTYIKLAWRNLWRNKRRTLITVASVVAAVFLSAIMTSMQEGSYNNMVKNIVELYSGHIQIHQKDYWENKSINNSFVLTDLLREKLQSNKNIKTISPRMETQALAAHKDLSTAIGLWGINPEIEKSITNLGDRISKGKYIKEGDKGVVIAQGLANYLKLGLNDSIVIIGQGYHGVSAFGKYPIRGIFEHPKPELNRRMVIIDIKNIQEFLSAKGLHSSVAIIGQNKESIPAIMDFLSNTLDSNYKAMTWGQMEPEMVSQIESDRAGGVVMKAILYVIIAFGILGTIMMMMAERKKELGVMIAVGMKKFKLAIILIFETIFIGLMGVTIGIVASIPVTWYFFEHPIRLSGKTAETMIDMGFEPIMAFSMMPKVYYNQAFTIMIFTLIIGVYPLINLRRMNVIKALRS